MQSAIFNSQSHGIETIVKKDSWSKKKRTRYLLSLLYYLPSAQLIRKINIIFNGPLFLKRQSFGGK